MSGSSATGDSVLSTAGSAAADVCYFAGCFPPSIAIAEMIPRGVGGPFTIGEASGAWKDIASTLQNIQQQLDQMCTGLSSDAWYGDDRSGFDAEVKNLLAELGDSHNTAEAIGITLEVLVPVFPVWVTESAAVAGVLGIAAGLFYAAAASGIGDITGVAEEIYADGLELSESCLEIMTTSQKVLIGILAAAAVSLGTATAVDIKTQEDHGDKAALGDLGQATVDGLGQDLVNGLSYGASRYLDKKGGSGVSEHNDPEGTSPSALTGYLRGMEQRSNMANRVKFQFGDKGGELGVDMSHIPSGLQQLINMADGSQKPDDLDEVAKKATGEDG